MAGTVMESVKNQSIVIFDGYCNFCSAAVQFIVRRDKKAIFRFTASQEPAGQRLVNHFSLGGLATHSIVLIEGNRVFQKSSAALRIARRLGGLWALFYIFLFLPRPLRDFAYDLIARSRYRLLGSRDDCFVPDARFSERFLK